jgi:hypothetical protein
VPNRILIGALSAASYDDRRQNCLDTWMVTAAEVGIDAVFLLGDPGLSEPKREERNLWLPVPDEYQDLPQKTQAFCVWAISRPDWDYLFKCDDDTAISIRRLLAYPTNGADYIGAKWKPSVTYASGGAGYLLSREAARIVSEGLRRTRGPEDLFVGEVLLEAGLDLRTEPKFIPWGKMHHRPAAGNGYITAHAVGREVFEAVHAECDQPG